MKKFGISLLSILLCCCVFAGCGKNKNKLVLDVKPTSQSINYSSVEKVDFGEGVTMVGEITDNGNVVVKKQVDSKTHHGVYSLVENKIVWAMRDSKNISLISVGENDYVKAELEAEVEGEETRYSIYTLNGDHDVLISELNDFEAMDYEVDNKKYEIWSIELEGEKLNKVYKLDGSRQEIYSREYIPYQNESVMPATMFIGEDGEGFVVREIEFSNGDTRYIVETLKGKVKADYVFNTLNLRAYLSFGKNAIVQYGIPVDEYSTKYDYIDNTTGEKFNVETYKFNHLTGKKSKIDCDYVLKTSANKVADNAILTSVNKIINGRVYEEMATSAVLFESGKVQELNYTYEEMTKLATDRYLASFSNYAHIVNDKFEVLASIYKNDIMAFADSYILIDENTSCNMIDFNGKVITELKYSESEFEGIANGYAIFVEVVDASNTNYVRVDAEGKETVFATKEGAVYKYGTTEVSEIAVVEGLVIVAGASSSGKTIYTLYNYAGDSLKIVETTTLTNLTINLTDICNGKNAYFTWNDEIFIVK